MMDARPARVRIFPLAGAILFPRAQLPLHVFEARYRDMVKDAIDGDGRIAMVQPLDPEDDEALHQVGCIGDIVALEELDDGRYNIILEGVERFRTIREPQVDTLYRQLDVDLNAYDDSIVGTLGPARRVSVEEEARAFGNALGLEVDWEAVTRLDDETLVNAISQVAPFDVPSKQALLEERELAGRADLLVQLMQFQRIAPGGPEADQTLQ
ncbi:LON peptidase substrate-binding domain-containing protein [Sphingomicrobium aestuariivivum]|uniref:LON peptidase substrate-binding domain-containing protein n=1 Tax=Sphingomicrobium aestuariivivum TaxID=1582356 RepID=UPI001FD70380|nr:LON peptidase substrate-binding domain-containing protein [Sphingomicrobium aestuariivivum]MCJ8191139.1 LON peptidase substrate-binding domain-containing protein [Sphingomicrobium aestuariivivum]